MDEQRINRALRQGPPFATGYAPSPLVLDGQAVALGRVSVGRLALIVTVTALLLAGMLAGLVVSGALRADDRPIANGWVAFVLDGDIHLVREGAAERLVIGSGSDGRDRACPAFSPDARRLAHGEAEGTAGTGYRNAALVISDVDAAGNVSESRRIEVGGAFPPPCAAWSADGRRVAFGVPLTSLKNPDRSAAGSAVWVVTVADGHVTVLSDLLATDLEWSPDGSQLAIASGQAELVPGESLRDGSIRLYDADRGEMRTLVEPSGVWTLSWSPDGSRIAYQRGVSDSGGQEIRVAQVDGSGDHVVTRRPFGAIRGIGPVWSPTGDRIVYQRMKGPATERHAVVLVTPDHGNEVVLSDLRLPGDPDEAAPCCGWRPSGVSWSPDGTALLYTAWRFNGGDRDLKALVSVPLDPGADPAWLHMDTGISSADGERAASIQSWGRLPDD
jgi:hypothetical protein